MMKQVNIRMKMGTGPYLKEPIAGFESMSDRTWTSYAHQTWEEALREHLGGCPDPTRFFVSRMEPNALKHELTEKISVLLNGYVRNRKKIACMVTDKPNVQSATVEVPSEVPNSEASAKNTSVKENKYKDVKADLSKKANVLPIGQNIYSTYLQAQARAKQLQDTTSKVPSSGVTKNNAPSPKDSTPNALEQKNRIKRKREDESEARLFLANTLMEGKKRKMMKLANEKQTYSSSQIVPLQSLPTISCTIVRPDVIEDLNVDETLSQTSQEDLEERGIEYRDVQNSFLERSKMFSNSHILEVRSELSILKETQNTKWLRFLRIVPTTSMMLRELLDI